MPIAYSPLPLAQFIHPKNIILKAIDALTEKWGKFVEGLIAPGAIAMFKERGIEVDRVFQRVRAHKNGEGIEIDILVVDQEYAILIEAKRSLG